MYRYLLKYEDLPIISSSSEIAAVVRGLYNALSVMLNNPLTTIGSYTTHENSPGNSPDFVTPASRFGWPARSRHAVACMHRFSHILRASCVPAVWIMPEWRAVDRAETRKYEDLPIISSSSEIAAVVRGLILTELLLIIQKIYFSHSSNNINSFNKKMWVKVYILP